MRIATIVTPQPDDLPEQLSGLLKELSEERGSQAVDPDSCIVVDLSAFADPTLWLGIVLDLGGGQPAQEGLALRLVLAETKIVAVAEMLGLTAFFPVFSTLDAALRGDKQAQ